MTLAQTSTSTNPSAPGQGIPGTQGVSPFAGSTPSPPVSGVLPLSLREAIDLGLKYNLGLLVSDTNVRTARGQRWEQLSALLPHVTGVAYGAASKTNLAELGFTSLPGATLPTSVGPFSYYDARVTMTQSVLDWRAIASARAAEQSLQSAQHSYRDARDLVVLAVGYVYLQAIADEARIQTAEAQVKTAQALYKQATDQVTAGTSPAIDGLRAKVELQTRQQQLIQATNNFAIQKLTVARVIGLPPGQDFAFTDRSPYQPFEGIAVEDALTRAYRARSDYQAAQADVRAAELSRQAAVAGYFPSLSFSASVGAGGADAPTTTLVFDVRGTLTIPLFEGGSVHGQVLQADARLERSRELLQNLQSQIDSDVRSALLNLQSSAELVHVARSSIDLAEQTLIQSRDRYSAGVTDTVEVVQSQEVVASAHEQYIASLYSYNFAKISLARALGIGEGGIEELLRGQ